MNRKIKITRDQINLGPKEPDEFGVFFWAGKLQSEGYIRISNAYCMIGRVDRDDWIDVLAGKMHCCNADFYMKDGSGPSKQWQEHYVRCYSQDKHTVAPEIARHLKSNFY